MHNWLAMGIVVRSGQVSIYVVEALLVALYLPEEMKTLIWTFDLPCSLRPPCQLGPAPLKPQVPLHS
jgi:hypothetical protein